MMKLLNHIVLYLDYLIKECKLNISVHFSEEILSYFPKETLDVLLKYNSHTNPYCMAVKRKCFAECIKSQKELLKKCSDESSFLRECHAGVYEYIYPIFKEKTAVGFIAVSGYRHKNIEKEDKLYDVFIESLSKDDIPIALLDAVIPPLAVMFYKLLSDFKELPKDEYKMILQFLSEYHTNITLDDLCRHFARSKSHISHMFKSTSGMTFRAYVNHLKLEDGKKLLEETELSVTDIALDVGFSDVSYFIHLFKGKFGMSPFKYRKRESKTI